MKRAFKRTDRIAEMVQRKLAVLIPQELKDPRFKGFVTISAVKVSDDLSYAKIYFTVLNDDPTEILKILNGASSYLRSALARTLTLRIVPHLQFIYDESIEYGKHLSKLIDKVNSDDSSLDDK